MSELINGAGDAALGWVRRHLFAILSIAAALGFAHAELVNLRESLDDARRHLEELRRDFIELRLSGVGVPKERFAEELAERREADRRHDQALMDQRARLLSLESAVRDLHRHLGHGGVSLSPPGASR